MLYRKIQKSIPPFFDAVGCIVTTKHKILLLKRGPDKSYPSRWGIPGGKVKKGETRVRSAIRELFEETGILVSSEQLVPVGTYHLITDDMSFLYSVFVCELENFPEVRVNSSEHVRINWFTSQDFSRLPLMPDLEECLRKALSAFRSQARQLNLFTGQPDAEIPTTKELEALVGERVAKETTDSMPKVHRKGTVFLGSPGTGKTAALKAITKEFADFKEKIYIPLKTKTLNKYLRIVFEEDDRSYALRLQLEMLLFKFRYSSFCNKDSTIVGAIYGTLAHSRALYEVGFLSDEEYQSFYNYYVHFASLFPLPAKVLYFHRTPENLVRVIKQRAMKFKNHEHERFYSDQYIFALSRCFSEVAIEMSKITEVISVDADSLSTQDVVNMYRDASSSSTNLRSSAFCIK
jgi:8-oxo-dGTP pyrophosphatase MutT (NUDIX family)